MFGQVCQQVLPVVLERFVVVLVRVVLVVERAASLVSAGVLVVLATAAAAVLTSPAVAETVAVLVSVGVQVALGAELQELLPGLRAASRCLKSVVNDQLLQKIVREVCWFFSICVTFSFCSASNVFSFLLSMLRFDSFFWKSSFIFDISAAVSRELWTPSCCTLLTSSWSFSNLDSVLLLS